MTEPSASSRERRPRIVRGIWVALGCAAMALGVIGAVLPILPTTPFVILAAVAFGKGAPRLRAALDRHRLFGPILAEWDATGAIAPRIKGLAVGMMAAALALSAALGVGTTLLAVQALCLAGAATFVLGRPNGGRL